MNVLNIRLLAMPRIQVLDSNGALACSYLGTGHAYYERDQFGETIAFFNTAILLNPRDARAYNNRGRSYLKLDVYNIALFTFRR